MITSAIEIRQWNKERIKSALQHLGTCKKADIARDTELSMATCSTAINEMLECGEILKVDQIAAGIGRPSDLFAYNRDFLHVLCICIFDEHGVPKVEFAVADALGNVIESGTAPVRSLTEESIQLLVAEKLHRDPTIRTVGIGVPGVVSDGVIERCDIAALTGADFPALLRAHFDVDVFVVNDINTITYYLYHNREQCRGNFASVYFPAAGAGYVGAGFIVDGHALSGTTMLSGGECQRLKLAAALRQQGKICILDEPSTGLHAQDVQRLLALLQSLVEQGHTVILVEHDLDLIAAADYVIDLGPSGGKHGGMLMFAGAPSALLDCQCSVTAEFLRRQLPN